MTVFKEMDPTLAWKALEGQKDILTPENEKLRAFYNSFKCPRCKGDLQEELKISTHTFSDPNSLLPRSLLRCPTCQFLIDPHSNIVLGTGNPSKIPIEPVPYIGGEK
jgi:hypothetical protein